MNKEATLGARSRQPNRKTSSSGSLQRERNPISMWFKPSMFKRQHKNSKHIRNICAIVDIRAQVKTIPESAVNKMPNAYNHRDLEE